MTLQWADDIDIRASLSERQSKYLKRLQKENKVLVEELQTELAESKSRCDAMYWKVNYLTKNTVKIE